MCGRYGFTIKNAQEVYNRFEVENKLDTLKSDENIPPGTLQPVISRNSPNKISLMFWGLIPHWAHDMSQSFNTINARAEGIENKPAYKKPFRFQRCLIPATGFYEWDKSTKPSTPYYFELKDKSLFAMAGLYDIWKDPKAGKELYSFTIITTTPNDVVSPVHHRMPVILSKEDEDFWLNPDVVEPERLLPLLRPYPSEEMIAHNVSKPKNKEKKVQNEPLKLFDN